MSIGEPRFINRERELSALKDFCSTSRALPLYIFGPEGCGKTRLLKEFVKEFNKYFNENGIAIYIDALERESVNKALLTSPSIKISVDIIYSIVEKFTGIEVGRALANSISSLLEKLIGRKRLKNKYILVAIDDVTRAIGLNKIEWYVKWLYELRWKLEEEYKPKAINFIVTTSEGISLDLISKHRHSHPLLIWNLDRKAFKELFQELHPPNNIEFEDIWRLFGGNPRKLIELAKQFKWNIREMLNLYEKKIKKLTDRIIKEGLVNELRLVIEDIDNLDKVKTKKMEILINMLTDLNLILYKYWPTIHGEDIAEDVELGIGKYYAWQIPAYKQVLQELLHRQNAMNKTLRHSMEALKDLK